MSSNLGNEELDQEKSKTLMTKKYVTEKTPSIGSQFMEVLDKNKSEALENVYAQSKIYASVHEKVE